MEQRENNSEMVCSHPTISAIITISKSILPSERSEKQKKKAVYCVIPFYVTSKKDKTIRDRNRVSGT